MPPRSQPPVGYDGIVSLCGDVAGYIRSDGTVSPRWEEEKIIFARLPQPMVLSWDPSVEIRRVRVHKAVAPIFEAAYQAVSNAGLWRYLRVFGGGYNFRTIRQGSRLSTHAFGLASDHDPRRNPLGRPPADCAMSLEVVDIMRSHGFTWGGTFSGRKDCMHFQFARRY